MDISNSGRQHINAQIRDHLALVGIRALAHSDHAVFLAADGSNLRLQRHSLLPADADQLFRLFHIFLDRIMGAVKHNGGEACFDTL